MSNKGPTIFTEFNDLLQGSKKLTVYPVSNAQCITIDLTVAHANDRLEIQGDFLYCDIDSQGECLMGWNNPQSRKIPISGGMFLDGFPIKEIYITNVAQARGSLNLWYGYGCNFRYANPYAQSSNAVEFHDTGFDATNTLTASTNSGTLAANVSAAMILPSQNPNGAIVWNIQAEHTVVGPGSVLSLRFAASAPNSIGGPFVTQVHETLSFQNATLALSNFNVYASMPRSIRIPAGFGAYVTSNVASVANTNNNNITYNLL